MESSKVLIKVGETHQRSEKDLGLHSWSLEEKGRSKNVRKDEEM